MLLTQLDILQEALRKMGLPHKSKNYMKALMDQFDTDHDDKVLFVRPK